MQIPLRLRPLFRHIRRAFSGPGKLETTAISQEILCPEETAELSPAIFLPGHLEKITGAPSESNAVAEIKDFTSRKAIHAPTIAYHIRNAALFRGSVYAGSLRHYIFDASLADKARPERIETATLASTFIGLKYFGHWIKDDCTLRLLCEDFGHPLCVRIPPHPDIAKYAGYLEQDWSTSISSAMIDHLVIMQDFAQNSLKKKRYEILRSRINSKFGGQPVKTFVYLKRGTTGASRTIHNENEIIDALLEKGFVVLDVASDSLDQILTVLSRAKLVVSIEGSHCAHCVAALPSGSGLILLQPPNRFCAGQRGWADAVSVRSGFVVGDSITSSSSSFSIPQVLKTIDLMLKHL